MIALIICRFYTRAIILQQGYHPTRGLCVLPGPSGLSLAAAAWPLQLPRALPPAHHACRPRQELDHCGRWPGQVACCIPCSGCGCAGARRCLTRRSPCTCSGCAGARRRLTRRIPCTRAVGAGARRCFPRRNPCTGFECAGARRCLPRRNPCTGSSGAGARRRLTRHTPCTRAGCAGEDCC